MYESQRTDLARRAQRERQWATSGVSKEKKNPRDNDKAQRDFRINRTERLASRARRTERAMEALEVVEKPWEGWDLRFSINEATRSGAVVVHLEDAVLERGSEASTASAASQGASCSGRSRWTSHGPTGSRWSARTDRARPRSSRRSSAACRWPPGRGASARAW